MAAHDGHGVVDAGSFGVVEVGDVALDAVDQPADAGDLLFGGGGVGAGPVVDTSRSGRQSQTTTSHEHHTPGETPNNQPDHADRATSRNRSRNPGEGVRVGEAIALDRDDIDWADRVLVVRTSKFNKSREVLLDPTVIAALRSYTHIRDRHVPHPASRTFFVSAKGTPVIYGVLGTVFRKLLSATGVGAGSSSQRSARHFRLGDDHSLVSMTGEVIDAISDTTSGE